MSDSTTVDLSLTATVEQWRLKQAKGTLTREEMKLALIALRHDRMSAAEISTKAKAKRAPVIVDSKALLTGLLQMKARNNGEPAE